jgi:hypothetical protein
MQAYEHVSYENFAVAFNEEQHVAFIGVRYVLKVGHHMQPSWQVHSLAAAACCTVFLIAIPRVKALLTSAAFACLDGCFWLYRPSSQCRAKLLLRASPHHLGYCWRS